MAKILGLDLGISSIGWCLFEAEPEILVDNNGEVITENGEIIKKSFKPKHVIDLGSFIFSEIEDGKTGKTENVNRRQKRLMRRQRRRRVKRLADLRELFKEQFHVDFLKDVIEKRQNSSLKKEEQSPFYLKVKGLTQKLTPEELMVALYHYMKHRGFKSNRKAADEADKDNKEMLGAIKDTKKHLEAEHIHVIEYLLKNLDSRMAINSSDNQIRNTGKNYVMAVTRAMYLDEINDLLDKQIAFGLIDNNFKDAFLKLYQRQRSFSEGPACSPFTVNLEDKVGTCDFDHEKRAPKDSISAKRFVLLSSLNNFRYRFKGEREYARKLTPEQIQNIEKEAISKKETSYSKVISLMKLSKEEAKNVEFKNLNISNKKVKQLVAKYCKDNNISSEERLDSSVIADLIRKEQLKTIFFKNSDLIIQLQNIVQSDEKIDEIAATLLIKKDDSKIQKALEKKGFDDETINKILEKNIDATKTIELSLSICQKLIVELRNGLNYFEAMRKLGYDIKKDLGKSEVIGEIPPIDIALSNIGVTLRNPVVKNTLKQLRKIINAIYKKYGTIDDCSIELSRELKKSFDERKEIRNQQKENQEENYDLRAEIIEKGFRKSFQFVTYDDLLRYKLYKEQRGISPYTNQKINERDIFDKEARKYEVDHIMPYSRSFDDSFNNKVLVETYKNQEKGNNLPTEKGEKFILPIKQFLVANKAYNRRKADNLLRKEIPEDFKNSNLTDTSYLSKLARDLITYYVLPENKICRTTSGGVTAFLRTRWNLSGKTHTYNLCGDGKPVSYENDLYQAKFAMDYKFNHVEINNNDDKPSIKFFFKTSGLSGNEIKETLLELCEFKFKQETPKKELPFSDKKMNEVIEDFAKSYDDCFKSKFTEAQGKTIDGLIDLISGKHKSASLNYTCEQYEEHFEKCMYLLGKVRSKIQNNINDKDRSNHLHHALDAAIIAVTNPTLVMRIAKANRDKKEGVSLNEQSIECPLPYDDFRREVLARVYERDEAKLLTILNSLNLYKNNPLTKYDVHVLIPVRQPDTHVKGAISKERIFGAGEYFVGDNQATKSFVATERISIDLNDKKNAIKEEDINNIVDKVKGNKMVYEALKSWLKSEKNDYPKLPSGRPIKSFKIYKGNPNKFIKLNGKENRLAQNDNVVRVEVYVKKDGSTENLYFVPIYYYQIYEANKKRCKSQINYTLMWGSTDNSIQIVNGYILEHMYKRIAILPRYSLIEIIMKSGEKSLAYSGGLTRGLFEVYSLIGDFQDFRNIFNTSASDNRYRPICSNIKAIKVRSISVLGKVS